LYGFPESHAASFALIAYASAYLKCHYLAAFTATTLNNQPMGFYQPMTIIKDAQRHGLRVKPIDVTRSDWVCTVEPEAGEMQLRLGLLYVRSLRADAGQAIVRERENRAFSSVEDLRLRVPELRKTELRALAELGALNEIESGSEPRIHRRSALWQVERAIRPSGPLLDGIPEQDPDCPLDQMTVIERLDADLARTGMTVGRHPMAHVRKEMDRLGITRADRLEKIRNNIWVKIAGCVIARQRPGSAKGFMFMSLEDETGLMNAIVTPDFFDQNRLVLLESRFLIVEGPIQNVDGVINIKARKLSSLPIGAAIATASHDFH
jgi:error-prone DNA polymerase